MVRRRCVGEWLSSTWFTPLANIKPPCRTVSAGVRIFSPPGLLRQEPGRQQRQRLVVVPPYPGAHLVVAQPRLTLGPLQALLDAVLRLEHPRELPQRRRHPGVGQQVVVL